MLEIASRFQRQRERGERERERERKQVFFTSEKESSKK